MRLLFAVLLPLILLTSACTTTEGVVAGAALAGYYAVKDDSLPKKPVNITYCYRTLSSVDCYDEPQAGEEYRLSGSTYDFNQPPPPEKPTLLDNIEENVNDTINEISNFDYRL